MEITPFESNCLIVLCCQRIYQDLPSYMLFCALLIVDWLSQCMLIVGTSFFQHVMSSRKLWSHFTYSPALSEVIYSNSIMDLAIHVCFEDFHHTTLPTIVNTYPLVDFVSIL